MKRLLLTLIYIVFCIHSYLCSFSDPFINYIDEIKPNINFTDSGIQLSYNTKNNLYTESKTIKKNIQKLYNKNLKLNFNSYYININNAQLSIYFSQNNKSISTTIELINLDPNVSIKSLLNQINKIKTFQPFNIKIHKYYRGKVNDNLSIDNLINNKTTCNNIKILNIHNGYCGTANLKTTTNINFAKIKYNTGSYLIIGTPIIFTTY